ncbi:MAG TPA: thiamine pyrophosphate-dependent enzyme, partial [Ferruginibacter sp.]|nr:thiamine pyrophosphate-dependent enzyme [Ferruginibacter sp.]
MSSDIAPTAGQMPRGLGLAFASKAFRNIPQTHSLTHLSNNGNEICFCTIGDASTSEGHFWETINAAGVLQVPLAVFVWDDGYGISVPKKYQTTKASVSDALKGFQKKDGTNGLDIYKLKGWDYAGMCEVLESAIQKIRDTHTPAVFHIEEITQPQGHSTSGSHERYKSPERLAWEKEWDGIRQMRQWIITNALAEEDELNEIEESARQFVRECKQRAWEKYSNPIKALVAKTLDALGPVAASFPEVKKLADELAAQREPMRRDIMKTLAAALDLSESNPVSAALRALYQSMQKDNAKLYNSYLYNEGPKSALQVPVIKPYYTEESQQVNGYEVLNKYFDELFSTNNKVVAFGEDLGFIGDVNQGFSGLQDKHGEARIFDTGIRELTIMGQGIGLALRGL